MLAWFTRKTLKRDLQLERQHLPFLCGSFLHLCMLYSKKHGDTWVKHMYLTPQSYLYSDCPSWTGDGSQRGEPNLILIRQLNLMCCIGSSFSLPRLNLSASCKGGCLNWVYSHLFWCVHPPTARYTWLYKKLPVSQCQVYWAPSVFYFSLILWFLCYSSCFCIVFPLWL